MPKPSLRTRSRKRRRLPVPGGRVEIHHKREKTGVPRCVRCGGALSGLRLIPSKLHKLPASQRRVNRMHGGQLCHSCLQDLLKDAVRKD